MKWIARSDERKPSEGMRILVFSPSYRESDGSRFRTLDGQFFKIMTDASHWMELEEPKVPSPVAEE